MKKYTFTIGLFDKATEKQETKTYIARAIIEDVLIDTFNIFAFTCWDCSGVYRMESTGCIVREPSIRVEIAADAEIPAAEIIAELKSKLNQETIMLEIADANISFI
jgi:hypothetical protein